MLRCREAGKTPPLDTRMRSIIICRVCPTDPSGGERAAGARDTAAPKGRLTSRDLLAGRDEVIIEHAGHEYHLRHTRAGKLILTE